MMCLIFFEVISLKKLQIKETELTFSEACEMYLDDCKNRNLREGTIKHYKQTYTQLFKFFNPDMLISDLNQNMYNNYILYLQEHLDNDISINSYLRDLITTLHFLMNNGEIKPFKMRTIKADKSAVETYSDEELKVLLQKPNMKKCTFLEYESWVISCLLFSCGIRQHSLMELKIKDIDTDNYLLNVRVTKSRKPLLIPINQSMINILKEFLRQRQPKNKDDWLFCNAFGQKLLKSTCYNMLSRYNKSRGIQTTGLHRYRHTFAKQWILNGGNVVTLSRILGHSSLSITQNYINLLVSDVAKQVDEINLLDKFSNEQKYLKIKRGKNK